LHSVGTRTHRDNTFGVPLLVFPTARPLIIAHRGASGLLPEQTLEAFGLAVAQGADAIEFDIVPTRDGVLIARHESELSATTNVADCDALVARRNTRSIDGRTATGWFAEDFGIDEIRMLRARQRFAFRDHCFDDRFNVPTLDDVLEWRSHIRPSLPLFIEIKHPSYFAGIGLPIPELLLSTLGRHDALGPETGIALMSFETRVLQELRARTALPLIQLLDDANARPFDWTVANDSRTYAELLTPEGLAHVATYADGIGPWKRLIVPALTRDADGVARDALSLAAPTSLIRDAHAAGLFVCAWTFRDEPQFLAADYAGDPRREYEQFLQLGLDAFTTDFPGSAKDVLATDGAQMHTDKTKNKT
jgi:glycerophosphoryl diester phosphodiesterase